MLKIHNGEVRSCLLTLEDEIRNDMLTEFHKEIVRIMDNLKALKIEEFITGLANILKVFYKYLKMSEQNSIEELLLTFLRIVDFKIDNQVNQRNGIININIQDNKTLFTIELKVDQYAEVVLKQIIDKKYFMQENRENKKCVLIGISYRNDNYEKNINSFAVKKINCGQSETEEFFTILYEWRI